MIVVDAAVVIEVLLNNPAGIQIVERFFDPDETLHTPHLIDVEVAQVLRRNAGGTAVDSGCGARLGSRKSRLELHYVT